MSYVHDMRALPDRYKQISPVDLLYKLKQKPLLFGPLKGFDMGVSILGVLFVLGIVLFFIITSGLLTASSIILRIIGILALLILGAFAIWFFRSLLKPKILFQVTQSGIEIEYENGSNRIIKWSDIESTEHTILQRYTLMLKSGENIPIADGRTANIKILDKLIQNLISFYMQTTVKRGIFADMKIRLSGRGIIFPVNLEKLSRKKHRLWIYFGLSCLSIALFAPVMWYRLVTLETALWLMGGVLAFLLLFIPWRFYQHRLRSKSKEVRLTDLALYTKIHNLEERIHYKDITKLNSKSSDDYTALAKTREGPQKIILNTQHGYILLQYLMDEFVAQRYKLRGRHV